MRVNMVDIFVSIYEKRMRPVEISLRRGKGEGWRG
jgi:hypothetical protein